MLRTHLFLVTRLIMRIATGFLFFDFDERVEAAFGNHLAVALTTRRAIDVAAKRRVVLVARLEAAQSSYLRR